MMNLGNFATDLESALDQFGVESVISTLAEIASEKGHHVESNWQDYGLAGKWHNFASLCHSLSARIPDAIR